MDLRKIYAKILNKKNNINNLNQQKSDSDLKGEDQTIKQNKFLSNSISSPIPEKPNQSKKSEKKYTKDYDELLEDVKNKYFFLYKSMSKLNPYQIEAIFNENKKTLVSAMVGSGKTTVLVHKILYLHFIKNVPLKDMAVLTFTNKAANEIKERIYSFYMQADKNSTYPELPYFGTFHAVARNLLINSLNLSDFGYKNDFTILDEEEKKEFYFMIMDELGLDIKYRNKIEKRIQTYNDLLNHHKSKILYGNMKYEDDIENLIEAGIERKKQCNVMDFDDLIIYVNMLLAKPKNKFELKWIIVDEFQDSSQQQIDLINNLTGKDTSIFVVGDSNQLIYTWRGSNLGLFNNFKKNSCNVYHLPTNYRSTSKILDVARCFVEKENKELYGIREEGCPVKLINHFDSNQEAIYLANTIKSHIKNCVPLREIAILVRTKAQLNIFKTVFAKESIPFELSAKINLKDIAAVAWIIALLKGSLNKKDINSIHKFLCHGEFGFMDPSMVSLKDFFITKQISANSEDVLKFCEWGSALTNNSKPIIELSEKIENFEYWLEGINTSDILSIFDYFNLEKFLKPTSIDHSDNVESVKDFLLKLKQYVEINPKNNMKLSLLEAINDLVLGGAQILDETLDPNSEKVKILTMHAAKGLEFRYVFISGANNGLIPLSYAFSDSAQFDEEKRLFFVALTRAKDFLEISYHTVPEGWNSSPEPSIFIQDIPKDLIEHIVSTNNAESSSTIIKETPLENLDNWKMFQLIKHPKYGQGVISYIDSKNIRCDFKNFGTKSFSVNFLPIVSDVEKIEIKD